MKQGWSSFMDRRVKERLVGATILVVLVVLIVPELLSGPQRAVVLPPPSRPGAAEPVRSVIVDLATNKATADSEAAAASTATAGGAGAGATTAGATSAADDTPGATGAGDAAPVTPPEPAATPPVPLTSTPLPAGGAASVRSGQGAAKAEAVHAGWTAQLGSFAARGNAEKLERRLRAQGFSSFVSSTGSGRTLRYRVRVGPVADRAAADKVLARLQKAGHAASVVAP